MEKRRSGLAARFARLCPRADIPQLQRFCFTFRAIQQDSFYNIWTGGEGDSILRG